MFNSIKRGKYFLVVLVIIIMCSLSVSAYSIERLSFNQPTIYDDTTWPTDSKILSSPFGPRLKASDDYRYDFHRGIDIPGVVGDNVYAIADGEVFRTYFEGEEGNPYPSGGNVIIVRHEADEEIEFHGDEFTKYYSIYMHLDEINFDKIASYGEYVNVNKGDLIGTMGDSGDTDFEHLHFEIRVGSTCSKETQSSGSCTTTYYDTPTDPHINPLMFLGYRDRNRIRVALVQKDPVVVKISSRARELDFNKIKIDDKIIDFNTREGIDSSNIDNNDYNGVVISPAQFNSETRRYEIVFEFDIEDFDLIEVTDIWGNGIRIK